MPTRDLGTKHTCFKCDTKFYDLKKPQAVCPKCGSDQREAPPEAKLPKRPVRPEPLIDEQAEETEEAAEEAEDDADDE